jgi:hypothetical protein
MVSFATPDYPKNSELLFGADGLSAPDEFYQMVPEGGFRNFRVAATREPFVISSLKTQVAILFDKDRRLPIPNNRLAVGVSAGIGDTEFSIFGNGVGRTQVVLFNKFGSSESKLVVSVKKKTPIRCGYYYLTDKFTKKPEGIESIMTAACKKIKQLYMNQANIDLIEIAPAQELIMDYNLSTLEQRDGKYVKVIYLEYPAPPPR